MANTYIDLLIQDAKCFKCLPDSTQWEIQTYILAVIAQLQGDVAALAYNARCLNCFSWVTLLEAKAYLLALSGNISTDPNVLILRANCYDCIPPGGMIDVQTYLLAQDPAGPGLTATNDLAQAAKCYKCYDAQTLLQMQVYSLMVLTDTPIDTNALAGLIRYMTTVPYPTLETLITSTLDFLEPVPTTSPRTDIPVADRPPRGNPYGGNRGGGVGRCTDDLTLIIPIITPTYAAGVGGLIQTIDLYFPRLCCQPGTYQVYGSNDETMAGAIGIRNGFTGGTRASPGVTIAGVNVSGFAYLYYAARQVCKDGSPVSGYSNVVGRTWMPQDSLDNYTNGDSLTGLNKGVNWAGAFDAHPPLKTVLAYDDLESYANGAAVLGLNGGTGWGGAYGT